MIQGVCFRAAVLEKGVRPNGRLGQANRGRGAMEREGAACGASLVPAGGSKRKGGAVMASPYASQADLTATSYFFRLRRATARPARPRPSRLKVAGSGMAVPKDAASKPM